MISTVCFTGSSYCQSGDLIKNLDSNKSSDTSKVLTFVDVANKYYQNSEYDSAYHYARSGFLLAHKQKFLRGQALCLNLQGLAQSYLGNYDKAERILKVGLGIANTSGRKKLQARLLNSYGICLTLQAKFSDAINYYLKSLKIEESIPSNDKAIANLNNNIGVIYKRTDNNVQARIYHHKALSVRKKMNDSANLALSYNNLANTFGYKIKSSCDSIIYYQRKSLEIREALKNDFGIAQCWNNMANYYLNTYEPQIALELYLKAYKKFKKIEALNEIINTTNNLSDVYFDLKDYKTALVFAHEALRLAQQNELIEYKEGGFKRVAKVSYMLEDYKTSASAYKNYIEIWDSTFNQTLDDKLTEARINFDYEKKADVLKVEQEKKDLLVKEEKNRHQIFIVFISIVLSVSVGFAIFIFKGLKRQRQANLTISQQKKEVEIQKQIVEEHQKEILDSIHYAKRIQNTLLAHHDFLNENIPNNFVYFNPKDIVSGDFYWATKHDGNFYLAVCDSTGHGVPGAFMSLLNIGFLSEAINEKNITKTNLIFEYVRERLISSVSKEGQKDGFDGIILRFNNKTNEISFTAANNAPILISNNELVELTKDKMPVGIGEKKEHFTCHKLDVKKGDMLYLYTDGYADQFGGPKGKKFKYKPLNDLLLSISNNSLEKQKQELETNFKNWKGELEQVDDVCVIGIRIN